MYCRNCGSNLDDDAKFCPVCGNPLYGKEAASDASKTENLYEEPKEKNLLDWNEDILRPPRAEGKLSDRNGWIIGISVSILFLAVAAFVISGILKVNSTAPGSDIVVNNKKTVGELRKEAGDDISEITNMEGTGAEAGETYGVPKKDNEKISSNSGSAQNTAVTLRPTITPKPTITLLPTVTPKPKASTPATAADTSGEYIFANSNSAYLTEAQLENLTKEQLLYARNEIYARHGRKFIDTGIQEYFNGKSWYAPSYEPEEFDAVSNEVFNDYEKKNIELIVKVEESKGYFY